MKELRIVRGVNAYEVNIQGKANEPITVAALLDRARFHLGFTDIDYPLDVIYDRLERNAPRVAIIGGSLDHPAHIVDWDTTLKAAYRIWANGGVPFYFGIPVVCDGTAQSNLGMCYSLESRNAVAKMIVNQMEGQQYHGAFVIQGCDKTPTGILCGLAAMDIVRRRRGDAPVFATFAPAHVLKGGTIPDELKAELEEVAQLAEKKGETHFADEIRGTAKYILQCSTDQAFQGIFLRMVTRGIISEEKRKHLEKYLSVATCDGKGGICAFNGTGNSSRHTMSAFGLVHPSVELLTEPPSQKAINGSIDALFGYCNNPDFSVSEMVKKNIENAVRITSGTGGSSNLMMHIVAIMVHAGVDFTLWDFDRIRRAVPVPEVFDYSLTEGRDIFALAQQCCDGDIRGMETVFHELMNQGVPMYLDAPTATGTTWRQRLEDDRNLSATGVKDNPIILANPKRRFSGIDALSGNFIESAVVKISGMKTPQIDSFDNKAFFGLYYENEEDATAALLDVTLLADLRDAEAFPHEDLLAMVDYNARSGETRGDDARKLDYAELFDTMVKDHTLKMIVFISGQGPVAFGMPEQFTPTQHINHNYELNPLVVLVSDGRFSGVSYGAAIGHVTPEAGNGGGILYLQTGDLFHLKLRDRQLDIIDRDAFRKGEIKPSNANLSVERETLGKERLERIRERRFRNVAPTNLMLDVTDAAKGVVPRAVAESVTQKYEFPG
ncbi:MAG: dihydroxy-acid dehydratase [Candidatus Poribacteria bacterium]|nr:dihydroxy-acid dehydratase [Candidatus Poribacteria bacterium]